MFNLLVIIVLLGSIVFSGVKDVLDVLNRRKKYSSYKDNREPIEEKLERKRREFEEFKKYIESCPQPEDYEVASNLDIEFDWSNISFIERLTVDDIVMNVNDKLLEHGCRVDYRNIALHNLRNPFPSLN